MDITNKLSILLLIVSTIFLTTGLIFHIDNFLIKSIVPTFIGIMVINVMNIRKKLNIITEALKKW